MKSLPPVEEATLRPKFMHQDEMIEAEAKAISREANAGKAVISGFLGWTIDAFDFFVLVFAVSAIAKEFQRSIPAIPLTRPVGAFFLACLQIDMAGAGSLSQTSFSLRRWK
jgi:hypothetical protein